MTAAAPLPFLPPPALAQGAASTGVEEPRTGTLLVVPEIAFGSVGRELAHGRLLVATVDEALVRPTTTLRALLDDAVEGALAFRGALPPSTPLEAPVDASILDQVRRARALGCSGLGLLIPTLLPLCDERGRMGGEDAEAFVAWLGATRRAPVVLVVGETSRGVSLLAPVSVGALAKQARLGRSLPSVPPPPSDPTPVTPAEPPRVEATVAADVAPPEPADPKGSARHDLEAPPAAEPVEPPGEPARARAPEPPSEPPSEEPVLEAAAEPVTPACPGVDPPSLEAPEAPIAVVQAAPPAEPELDADREDRGPSLLEAMRQAISGDAPAVRRAPARRAPPPPRPNRPAEPSAEANDEARAAIARAEQLAQLKAQRDRRRAALEPFARELEQARGPKPPKVLEQLFLSRYLPLLEFVCDGPTEPGIDAVVSSFRDTFERSYTESFSAIRVTGKRPSMVFDAPEIAARLARLNGARQVHLVLVDAMSASIGERVLGRLKGHADGGAVCVERLTLWSALPTDTATQLALLARGVEGLRDGVAPSEPDPGIARGRAVSTLRRERVGSRDLLKLDLVEARLRGLGPGFGARLDGIADEVAEVLARHLATLPPRTLCFVFGDHGFQLPVGPDGLQTGEGRYGGASPEEVLVPGYALLTGGVH